MRFRSGRLAIVLLLVTATAGAACSKDSAEPGDCHKISGHEVTLVARNVAWDATCLEVKHGTVAFTIDNTDSVKHNVRVTGNGVNGHTALQNGPIVQRLSVRLAGGTYSFICDIHANMEGKLFVK